MIIRNKFKLIKSNKSLLYQIIYLSFFTLFFIDSSKANLEKKFKSKNSLITTSSCNYKNSQFSRSKKESDATPDMRGRFCVDYKNKTIFRTFLNIRNGTESPLDRQTGFLDSPEAGEFRYSYYLQQWGVEGNYLYRYWCQTYSLTSKECNSEIKRMIEGYPIK